MIRPSVSGAVSASTLSLGMPGLLLIGQLVKPDQLFDDLFLAAVFDAVDDASVKVAFEHQRLHLLDGAADGVRLLKHVDAVLVGFDHPADALQMALDKAQ